MGLLGKIGTFGGVAAEDDAAMLSYFLKTDAVDKIANGDIYAVIGRKGSGKTALTKFFSRPTKEYSSAAPTLRDYPWNLHQRRRNLGASDIESYVTSWRYLIAVKVLSVVLEQRGMKQMTDSQRVAREFLNDNYGGIAPTLIEIVRPKRISVSKAILSPSILGNSLGSMELESKDGGIPPEIDDLATALFKTAEIIIKQAGIDCVHLHFDELDQGLSELDDQRKQMLIGLILAIRNIRSGKHGSVIKPVFYIRTDIWDELKFSDKNKISQSSSVHLDWDSSSLLDLINERIKYRLGDDHSWNDITDDSLMRGSQSKWSHIVSRTFNRPRDVIQFLNFALEFGLKSIPDADFFENEDIQGAREPYSRYLKQELDDEIGPHWESWSDVIQSFSELRTLTFQREDFVKVYDKRKSKKNPYSAEEALELLYGFSVIGFRRGLGGGGSGWVFQYTDPHAGWDSSASLLKVHLGLKEFAKLREERAS